MRDLRAARDDLERRVHDLKLTRQVTMQSLPSIRLVQENDKCLVTKINSTLVNTVPLWETQLAQAVTIQRSREAAEAVRAANDLTNELLTANAENLQEANRVVRTEMERGVFDIEAVKKANDTLIATIKESLQIADEGKAKRAAAEAELTKMEHDLRDTLASAKARDRRGRRHRRHLRSRILTASDAPPPPPPAPAPRRARPRGVERAGRMRSVLRPGGAGAAAAAGATRPGRALGRQRGGAGALCQGAGGPAGTGADAHRRRRAGHAVLDAATWSRTSSGSRSTTNTRPTAGRWWRARRPAGCAAGTGRCG